MGEREYVRYSVPGNPTTSTWLPAESVIHRGMRADRPGPVLAHWAIVLGVVVVVVAAVVLAAVLLLRLAGVDGEAPIIPGRPTATPVLQATP